MNTPTRRFPYTTLTFALALLVLVMRATFGVDVFDIPGLSVIGIEQTEMGESVIAFLMVIPAFFIDGLVWRQRGHEAQLQAERLRVVQVTMRTVQEIVNNALNELQLMRVEAEPYVSKDVLAEFDRTIQGTAAKLRELGDLDTYVETQMAVGTGLARASRPN